MATSNSASPPMEPLDALQSLINDVLVQTGKALRASRRDAQGNLTHAYGPSQSKLPDTIDHFHNALNELESEIIGAKSVLLRDYNELQERKKKLLARSAPQLAEAQTKRPLGMNLPSPPEPMFKEEPMAEDAEVKPMAPFPNMSIDLAEPEPMDMAIKESHGPQPQQQQQQPPPPGGMNGLNGTTSPGIISHMSVADQKPMMDMLPEPSGSNHPAAIPEASGMHFTDMEFTLAPPPGSEVTGQPNASKEPSFDMTTFAPADGGDDLLHLNHLLPADAGNSIVVATQAHPASQLQVKMEDVKVDVPDATMSTDFFGPESGAADGMDFDFSLGGTGDDTFDDLMNNRDSTFELMDAGGDFDSAFFGLDKPDENPA